MSDDTTTSFDDLLEANERFASDYRSSGLTGTAGRHLAVVTCIDSRLDPLGMLGLKPGDAKIMRTAGARVTDDVLRSLILAASLLEVERIAVIQHTDCAMARADDSTLRAAISEASGSDASTFEPLTMANQLAALTEDVDRVRDEPLIPDSVVVQGFLYDVATGALSPRHA